MQTTIKAILIATATILFSCARNNNTAPYAGNQDAASEKQKEIAPKLTRETDVQKMQRQAQLKFRTKDAQKSTLQIEKLTRQHGGYVAQSNFDVTESESLIKPYTQDSSIEIKKLYQRNEMIVYVLNTKLDSFLAAVSPIVEHLEYRYISATEMARETKSAAENNSTKYNYSSAADVEFCYVNLYFYQSPIVKKWIVPNPNSFEAARGGFFTNVGENIQMGWHNLGIFVGYFMSLWPIWMLILLFWVWWRRKNGKSINLQFWKKRKAIAATN